MIAMTNLSKQIFLILAKWQNMARKSSRQNQTPLVTPGGYYRTEVITEIDKEPGFSENINMV
jgi:hypothetical protein